MFAYSMREKTHAHRTLEDSVPEEVKSERLREMQNLFYQLQVKRTQERYLGSLVSVLVEGPSKKNPNQWQGMSENNRPVVFEATSDPSGTIVKLRVVATKGSTLIGQQVEQYEN
jgi:tRNA-2-methylthio-N6-dimethylallyladenosine synthase